jgi:NhaA family Na+:H+ antiporter
MPCQHYQNQSGDKTNMNMKTDCRGDYSIKSFFDHQIASGLFILLCAIGAIVIANSPFSADYFNFLDLHFEFGISKSVKFWINDLLMTVFFLLIGFEIKRELIAGELSKLKNAMYPLVAALGGMIVPIAIFLLLNFNLETVHGWGIPMSTDIAFVISIMLVLGSRITKSSEPLSS